MALLDDLANRTAALLTDRTGERAPQNFDPVMKYPLPSIEGGSTEAAPEPAWERQIPRLEPPQPEWGEGALRPCPFCGEPAVLSPASDTDPTPTIPGCSKCDVWVDDVAAWNHRAAYPEPAEGRDRYRDAIEEALSRADAYMTELERERVEDVIDPLRLVMPEEGA